MPRLCPSHAGFNPSEGISHPARANMWHFSHHRLVSIPQKGLVILQVRQPEPQSQYRFNPSEGISHPASSIRIFSSRLQTKFQSLRRD